MYVRNRKEVYLTIYLVSFVDLKYPKNPDPD